jgi:hypothetical protein
MLSENIGAFVNSRGEAENLEAVRELHSAASALRNWAGQRQTNHLPSTQRCVKPINKVRGIDIVA